MEERLEKEKILEKRNKKLHNYRANNTVAPNITFDHKGKVLHMKKVKEESLPSVVLTNSTVKKKIKNIRQPNRPEDKPKDLDLINKAKGMYH